MRTLAKRSIEPGFLRTLAGILAAVSLVLISASGQAQDADGTASTPPGTIEFTGKNLFATANGTFHSWRLVAAAVDPDALEASTATVEIDLASVDTGIERRDDHLRNPDFFEVERFPVATVRFHSAERDGETEAGEPRYRAKFDIDLHGVRKTLDGEVVRVSEDPLAFEGSLVVDRTAFGVGGAPSRWNPMAVRAEIPVSFRVEP